MKCRTLIMGIILLFCIADMVVLAQDEPSPIRDPEPEPALSGGGGGGGSAANGGVIEELIPEEERPAICMQSDGSTCYNEPCDCDFLGPNSTIDIVDIYDDSEVIPLCCPEGERACPGGASPEAIPFELFLENLTGYTAKCVKPSNETAMGDVGMINVTNLIVTQEGVVFKFGNRKCINREDIVVDLPGAVIIQPCDEATCSCPVLSTCSDGIDNDGDGLIDLDDKGCVDANDDNEIDNVITLPQCSDGIDNDGDTYVDLDDEGCADADDTDESNPLNMCNDGVANKRSGLIDCADPVCKGYPLCKNKGDKDKGHGNDADRCDEDNPGKSGCNGGNTNQNPAENGKKKGWLGRIKERLNWRNLGFFRS